MGRDVRRPAGAQLGATILGNISEFETLSQVECGSARACSPQEPRSALLKIGEPPKISIPELRVSLLIGPESEPEGPVRPQAICECLLRQAPEDLRSATDSVGYFALDPENREDPKKSPIPTILRLTLAWKPDTLASSKK